MNKYNFIIFLTLLMSLSALGQQNISGKVKTPNGKPVEGALVSQVNTPNINSITDKDGIFTLKAQAGDCIEINYNDYLLKRVWITNEKTEIVLTTNDRKVIQNIATGTKNRQTQAISTVNADDISKNASPNTYNTLYGLLPGLMQIQNTAYNSNPDLSIRGGGSLSGSPLIIVDGYPRPIGSINPSDIESVTVLKDGATALYGVRGANGVVIATTKRGLVGPMKVDLKYTYGQSLPTNRPTMANAATYAKAVNEALYYDGLATDKFGRYSQQQIDLFQNGNGDADLYPNTDWLGAATRNNTTNNQMDINFRGGSRTVRYYSSLFYKNDIGILNPTYANYTNRYNSQIRNYKSGIRMNLDIDLTKTTLLKLNMFGLLSENSSPNLSIAGIFNNLYNIPSAAFPIKTMSGKWGSSSLSKINPLAEIADKGYYKTNGRLLQSDMHIQQNLSNWTKGLKAELSVSFENNALFQETGTKTYQYEINTSVFNSNSGLFEKFSQLGGLNNSLNLTNANLASQYMIANLDAKLSYDRAFGGHNINAELSYRQESDIELGRNNTRYREYIVGMLDYNYKNKYMVDALLNRSGTSVLPKGDKFRFYPALSMAWLVSNEDFLKSSSVVNYLKVRASYGRSGNDNISYDLDKQFWVTGTKYYFQAANNTFWGLKEGPLANKNLSLETSDKFNIGVDIELLKNLSVSADGFFDKRRGILVNGASVISSAIGIGVPFQNIGAVDTKGVEFSALWKQEDKNFNYYLGANLTLARSKVLENGEGYQPFEYMYKTGYPIGQAFGLEKIGYFADQTDIKNSPEQLFSQVRPGDIKYKDLNNDGKINEYDVKAIGKSTTIPGLYFGFNLGCEYKGFGIDAVFQGVGEYSKILNTANVYWPLRNNTNISTWYLEDKIRWTEETKETANVPRLTTQDNANNFRTSTQWLVDGSYLKLRNLNIYYNLPEKLINKIKMEKIQIYIKGNNLLSFDNIKYMNCEDLSLDYLDMKSFYVGINIKF